uniref:Cullin 1 n=2 Tax=Nannochloropsis gaditana TaxID=72520 RepID=I2CQT5_NANGC
MASAPPPNPITIEEGWEKEILPKAILPLERILNEGLQDRQRRDLFGPREYVHIYTICYNMCTQRNPFNWSEPLYQKHNETISDYLTRTVLPSLRNHHKEYLLVEVKRRWENHKIMNEWMRKFFMYLDRYYVKHNNLTSLHVSGIKFFKEQVYDVVKPDVVQAMLAMINLEREGQVIDRALIKSCVEIFETMGEQKECYKEDLEETLLSDTREYYAKKSQGWIETDSTPAYLLKAEAALEEEKARVANYLNAETEEKLLKVVIEELLEKQETTLLEREGSGCAMLLTNDKYEDLSRMYRLFSRVSSGLLPMAKIVQAHIERMGNEVINQREARIHEEGEKDTNQDPNFVKALLSLHDKFVGVVNAQFEKNSLFHKALKEAFVEFVNKDVGKFKNADLLSSFCDRILKKGGEKLGDAEVENHLEKVVNLFTYLTDKDLFAEIYRNQLAKRLLNARSSSDDWEKLMIGKLKHRCGAQFTGKMEGMLNDLAVGADHQKEFLEYLKDKATEASASSSSVPLLGGKMAPDDFSVKVLTTGYWPSYTQLDVRLPDEMLRCTQAFKAWYDLKNSRRRLAWQHSLGSATLRAKYGAKTYDLQTNTLQAVLLLSFQSDEESLGLSTLKERLNVPTEQMKPLLHSLSCGRYKILKKQPASDKIKETDTFTINPSFSCPQRVIRIPMATIEESHNPNRIEEDRSIAIEAAIVRIMKARKVLTHQQLTSEVLSQLAFFRPNPKVVKQRIHALIDREYLERDENPNQYKYLA